MKGLLISAVIIGAMANQLDAQNVATLEPGGGAHSYSLEGVVVLPVRNAVPPLMMASPHQWGLPYTSAGGHITTGVPEWAYRDPCVETPEVCTHGSSGFPDWGYASDPAFYPNTSRGLYPVLPSAVVAVPVIQQAYTPAPPASPSPAPAVARSEMREYHWPSAASDASAKTYSIVSKDGHVQSATAVWVQDNAVCYYTPDRSTGRMPIDSIDLEATHQRNADKQLNLWLPGD